MALSEWAANPTFRLKLADSLGTFFKLETSDSDNCPAFMETICRYLIFERRIDGRKRSINLGHFVPIELIFDNEQDLFLVHDDVSPCFHVACELVIRES